MKIIVRHHISELPRLRHIPDDNIYMTLHDHYMQTAKLREIINQLSKLVAEVQDWHGNPDSGEYNACEDKPCHWCKEATKLLGEIAELNQPNQQQPCNLNK